jgi:hypothetical protein
VSPRTEGARALLHAVAPLAFLRDALCLDGRYRRERSCGPLQAVGYGHHAYAKAVDPNYVAPGADNVTLGALGRLESALDRAASAGALKKRLPIFITEFGVQSYPNRRLGVPVATQAIYDAIAEHIAWADERVAAFSQYLLRDDPLGGPPGSSASGGFVGFQTGLEYADGAPKPLYAAWPVPLTVTGTGGGVSLWGLVRPASGATRVTVLVRAPGARDFSVWRVLGTESLGYWHASAPIRGAIWRVRWRSPGGARYEGAAVPE